MSEADCKRLVARARANRALLLLVFTAVDCAVHLCPLLLSMQLGAHLVTPKTVILGGALVARWVRSTDGHHVEVDWGLVAFEQRVRLRAASEPAGAAHSVNVAGRPFPIGVRLRRLATVYVDMPFDEVELALYHVAFAVSSCLLLWWSHHKDLDTLRDLFGLRVLVDAPSLITLWLGSLVCGAVLAPLLAWRMLSGDAADDAKSEKSE